MDGGTEGVWRGVGGFPWGSGVGGFKCGSEWAGSVAITIRCSAVSLDSCFIVYIRFVYTVNGKSSDLELTRRLQIILNNVGVLSSDQLPDLKDVYTDNSLIANYSSRQ